MSKFRRVYYELCGIFCEMEKTSDFRLLTPIFFQLTALTPSFVPEPGTAPDPYTAEAKYHQV